MAMQDKLINNLDKFIRKYYKNQLIKGVLYSIGLLLVTFLAITILEYFGYFSTWVRTLFFWLYIAITVLLVVLYILIPLSKMYKIGRRISYEQAAWIIGKYFPEVSDKLLNLLQLKGLPSAEGSDLLEAGIRQKTENLSPIPFAKAIDLKQNKKYVKYAFIPVLLLIGILIFSPSIIKEPSARIINHTTYYEKPAPFAYRILNKKLEIPQQEDFLLQVKIEGDDIPNEVFINIENQVYKMQKLDKITYSYLFKNVQKSQRFFLEAVDVKSSDYLLTVFPKPTVVDFQVKLSYPAYTGKQPETLSNIGDLTIPEGTTVQWLFQTKDVKDLYFMVNETVEKRSPNENGRLSVAKRFLTSADYGFYVSNPFVLTSDTLRYSVSSIVDVAPMIAAIEMRDSVQNERLFFKGKIKDDYGFSKLQFKMIKTNGEDTTQKRIISNNIPFKPTETAQEFYYATVLEGIEVGPGDRIEYYFEVWDNDAIHGPKSSKSQIFEIKIPTEKELQNALEMASTQIKEASDASMSEIKKMQNEINEMMRKLVNKQELTWQDKKQLEELAKKQKTIKETVQKMQEQMKQNNQLEQQYRKQTESIIEKQKELDRLYNEVMNDEMKEMMKEMEKLMQEADKKKVQQALEELKMKNENIEKQLDQNIELLQRLELEKMIENAIKKTEDLAEKQRDLANETEQSGQKKSEALSEKQDKLNKEFQELQKDIDKVQQKLKQIDEEAEFKRNKETENSISNKQNEASKQLNKGKHKNASEQQKSAADELDKLSNQLAEAQMDMEQEDLAEDAEKVRQLLKNLVTLSFDQEKLIGNLNTTLIQDPMYQKIIANQNKIKDDFKTIEDSLRGMAKRQIKVASVINKEVGEINTNIAKSMNGLLQMNQTFYGNSKNMGTATSMQYAMTSLNNLALVLAESLDQMQSQMRQNSRQKKSGNCKKSGSCKNPGNNPKPGKGKPSPGSMKQMQDALNKQMEAMKKQLDKQGQPKGRGKMGENGMSEEFARMAALQEQIRRMMQKYGEELKQQSGGAMGKDINNVLKQMEQTETDLVNKTISRQTMERQQQIMTRLLEHEKAEMKREKEQRRESTEGKDIFQVSKENLEEYNKLKQKELEMFRTAPPSFTNYYKMKVNEYFYKFEN